MIYRPPNAHSPSLILNVRLLFIDLIYMPHNRVLVIKDNRKNLYYVSFQTPLYLFISLLGSEGRIKFRKQRERRSFPFMFIEHCSIIRLILDIFFCFQKFNNPAITCNGLPFTYCFWNSFPLQRKVCIRMLVLQIKYFEFNWTKIQLIWTMVGSLNGMYWMSRSQLWKAKLNTWW